MLEQLEVKLCAAWVLIDCISKLWMSVPLHNISKLQSNHPSHWQRPFDLSLLKLLQNLHHKSCVNTALACPTSILLKKKGEENNENHVLWDFFLMYLHIISKLISPSLVNTLSSRKVMGIRKIITLRIKLLSLLDMSPTYSDQHWISPSNMDILSNRKVMGIKIIIYVGDCHHTSPNSDWWSTLFSSYRIHTIQKRQMITKKERVNHELSWW